MGVDGKTIGLALSGGGFRATLFGLGSLWRLNDAGLLGQLDRITSVSGGSIVAGVLAHRWRRLRFDGSKATNFEQEVVRPVRVFCAQTIDVGTAFRGIFNPFRTAAEFLAERYAQDLFGADTLASLPAAGDGVPRFVLYATNLQTGRSFRFRQDMLADWVLGINRTDTVRLADAVAASSAFPPVFSPVVVNTDPAAWEQGDASHGDLSALRRRIVLTDGGVYDNMGLETLLRRVDICLVSDAGAPFDIVASQPESYRRQLARVRDILIDQTRALRKRWLMDEFRDGRRRGAYWGIGTRLADYPLADPIAADLELTGPLELVPTRLAAFDPDTQGRLVNWGYALADAALRSYAGFAALPAGQCPIAAAPLGRS